MNNNNANPIVPKKKRTFTPEQYEHVKAKAKEWYENNKERAKNNMRRYYAALPPEKKEQEKERKRQCDRDNRERYNRIKRERKRANKEKNAERDKEYSRNWYEENKERLGPIRKDWVKRNETMYKDYHKRWNRTMQGRFSHLKKNAELRGHSLELTIEQHEAIIKDGICHYCNGPLNPCGSGMDRKDSAIGYRQDNVVPCCKRCNATFLDNFNYEEKLMLGKSIQEVDRLRTSKPQLSFKVRTANGFLWCKRFPR